MSDFTVRMLLHAQVTISGPSVLSDAAALTAEALDFAAKCIAGRAIAGLNHEIMRARKVCLF
jgi:hypothetical protein